ncbi:transport protein Sec23-like protein [Tanacetum coccineum]
MVQDSVTVSTGISNLSHTLANIKQLVEDLKQTMKICTKNQEFLLGELFNVLFGGKEAYHLAKFQESVYDITSMSYYSKIDHSKEVKKDRIELGFSDDGKAIRGQFSDKTRSWWLDKQKRDLINFLTESGSSSNPLSSIPAGVLFICKKVFKKNENVVEGDNGFEFSDDKLYQQRRWIKDLEKEMKGFIHVFDVLKGKLRHLDVKFVFGHSKSLKNEVSLGYEKFDMWKWPTRKKIDGTQWFFGKIPKVYVFNGAKEITKDQVLEQIRFFLKKPRLSSDVVAGVVHLLGVNVPGFGARIMAFLNGPAIEGPVLLYQKPCLNLFVLTKV